MRAANAMAGFSMAEADVLRKAVGKKDPKLIRRELNRFVKRAEERGVRRREAEHVASLLETFGRYGFNKAHAAAYAVLSYRTAWLKCHYPAEFMAALLSSEIGNTDKVVGYINESRALDLEVLPPHVNESGYKFTVVDDRSIRFGLGAIRGVGRSAIESIKQTRAQDGPFESLFDFCSRVDLRLNNRKVVEALIGAGALDGLGRRSAMVAGLEATLHEAQLRQREREAGQQTLFGGDDGPGRPSPTLPDVPEWSESERLAKEKELVGFFVSGHPLDRDRDLVEVFARRVNTSNLREYRDRKVHLAGVVTEVDRRISRRDGNEWARLVVEDYQGTAVALAFREAWSANRELLPSGAPLLLEGTVSGRTRDEEDPPLFLDSATRLADLYDSGRIAVCLDFSRNPETDPNLLESAAEIARAHPGPSPLQVLWQNGGNEPARLRSRLSVRVAPEVLTELRQVLGPERVRLVRVAAAR